jgi:hypothetical protein
VWYLCTYRLDLTQSILVSRKERSSYNEAGGLIAANKRNKNRQTLCKNRKGLWRSPSG